MKALVLAAGKGTRIAHLANGCPKPMLPVAGRPLLEHLFGWLRTFGIYDIAVNLHHLPDVITRYFGNGQQQQVILTYSYEPELRGTAGAAKRLAWFLDETFVVLYGDVYTNIDLRRLIEYHHLKVAHHNAALTLALYQVSNPSECGLVSLNDDGRVTRFVEKPPVFEVFTNLASAGILVCEPQVLQYIPADTVFDFGRDLLPYLLRNGHSVYGQEIGSDEFVIDIGTPAGYAWAQEAMLISGAYPASRSLVLS
jgi:NDP-sugar pyrophosphorylase family protein